jgi:hypothetical protein
LNHFTVPVAMSNPSFLAADGRGVGTARNWCNDAEPEGEGYRTDSAAR